MYTIMMDISQSHYAFLLLLCKSSASIDNSAWLAIAQCHLDLDIPDPALNFKTACPKAIIL